MYQLDPIISLTNPAFSGGIGVDKHRRKEIHVSSVYGSNSNNGSVQNPVATLVKALSLLGDSSNNPRNLNDIIVLHPGHSESIDSATELAIARTGVQIRGIGRGVRQPKLQLATAATATITISVADVLIHNVHIEAGFADITAALTLTTAKNLHLVGCRFSQNAADLNFVDFIKTNTTDNAADGLLIKDCYAVGSDAANDNFLNAQADIDRLVVDNNYIAINVAASEAIIEAQTGKDFTNCLITNNKLLRLNTAGALAMSSDTTANSGIIAYNVVGHADTAAAACWDVTGARLFQNYALGVDDASGLLIPAVDDNA